jgi:osmotically-inducible protein OsmY
LVGCVAIAVSPAANARSNEAREVGSDHFAAGSSVRVEQPVAGDLLAAGGQVDVAAQVRGDAIVAGGNVRLGADLGNSVYAFGGQLTLTGTVANNAVKCSSTASSVAMSWPPVGVSSWVRRRASRVA